MKATVVKTRDGDKVRIEMNPRARRYTTQACAAILSRIPDVVLFDAIAKARASNWDEPGQEDDEDCC